MKSSKQCQYEKQRDWQDLKKNTSHLYYLKNAKSSTENSESEETFPTQQQTDVFGKTFQVLRKCLIRLHVGSGI